MKVRCLPAVAALVLATAGSVASAQSDAPPPLAAASAPSALKPGPRLLTPAQSRDSASPPGEIRPAHPVTPQISIPFGKKPPAPLKPARHPLREGSAASAGRVDDAAARCEARLGEQVRAKCRAELAHEAGRRVPR